MEQCYLIQGRHLGEADLAAVRSLIETNPGWSRRRISVELAQVWDWRTGTGQLKDMAARSLLLKLEQRGMLILPARRRIATRRSPIVGALAENELTLSAAITCALSALQPLRLEAVRAGSPERALLSGYLARHHYLGFGGPVGENIAYLARDRFGRGSLPACSLVPLPGKPVPATHGSAGTRRRACASCRWWPTTAAF